jgi:hypothetical protein
VNIFFNPYSQQQLTAILPVISCSFEELLETIKSETILFYVRNMFKLIKTHLPMPTNVTAVTFNARVLAAAYLIYLHPTRNFEFMGFNETVLLESARKMLGMFNDILQLLTTGTAIEDLPLELKEFTSIVCKYNDDFYTWKLPDAAILDQRLISALVALHHALSSVSDDEDDSRNQLQAQITKLTDKLQSVAGNDGMLRLQQALRTGIEGHPNALMTSGRMHKEQLAYELFLDAGFKFNDDGTPSNEQTDEDFKLAPDMPQQFWDALVFGVDNKNFASVWLIVRDVQLSLKECTGPAYDALRDDVVNLTDDFRNADFLRDWPNSIKFLSNAASLVSRVQMQHRDEAGKAQWQRLLTALEQAEEEERTDAFCDALHFIYNEARYLRVDGCNQRLATIAPVVGDQKVAINYLQEKFAARRENAGLTIKKTEQWLGGSVDELSVKEFRQLVAGDTQILHKVHLRAFIDLAMSFQDSTPPLPEVFGFDKTRLKCFSNSIEQLITCGTIMRIISNSTEDDVVPTPQNIDSLLSTKPAESQFQFISCCVQSLSIRKQEDIGKVIAIVKESTLQFTDENMEDMCSDLALVFNPNFIERISV